MLDRLELVHRIVGYPTAFVVGPAALLALAIPRLHRRWGRAYAYLMLALYASGTILTLARHDWGTWGFARNLVFNAFGFATLLHGWRAIHRFRAGALTGPGALDHALAGLQLVTVAGVVAVAVMKDTPMRVFAIAGLTLCALDLRDLRDGFRSRTRLFQRHVRYVLASYYYVLTVVSIVHLDRAVPRNLKWLWPTLLGAAAIWLATTDPAPWTAARAPARRAAVVATLVAAAVLGAYVAWQLVAGAAVGPQALRSSFGAGA